jgi:hypothetical protein
VRALALALLCSCAAPLAQPSSLPRVRVDRSLSGPVCSREALETITTLRIRERTQFSTELNACVEEKKVAKSNEAHADKRADASEWWARYGPAVVSGTGVAAFLAGVGLMLALSARQ